jgi:hypothetical protein
MYCFKLSIAGRIRKTAAALSAVVFLFLLAGCCSADCTAGKECKNKRPIRKRASDYSRIPGNYPANWQTTAVGH